MKNSTPPNLPLSKRLANYGTMTLAIAGLADANGQIVYTDLDPDEGGPGEAVLLDLNNDGTDDFAIVHFNSATYDGVDVYNILAAVELNAGNNGILGSTINGAYNTYVYPFALSSGYTISSGNGAWQNTSYQTMAWNACAYPGSNWCDQADKYLGLRFTVDGNVHYGWARLSVEPDPANGWVVKDYAFNATAGEAIDAGQTVLGLEDSILSETRVVALNKTIGLYNLKGKADYTLYSISGAQILSGQTELDTHLIEANTLSNGIYILKLQDPENKAVLRKKIVL